MRAVVVTRHGGPQVLAVEEVPDPTPGAGEVLVAVAVAGVNFIDVYQRAGVYPKTTPFVAGLEGAGRVAALGDGTHGIAVGHRVAWPSAPGSYAEMVVLPADGTVPVPDDVDEATAAAVVVQGLTAHYLAVSAYPVAKGDVAVVHAAAGGVGQLLTQMVKSRGGRVIATVSSADKEDIALEAGADVVLPYDGFAREVRRLTGGTGAHVVYDGVGKATFDGSLAALRPRGMLVLYGASSGQVPPVDLQRLNAGGSLYVTRPNLAHYTAVVDELRWRAREVFSLLAAGQLRLGISGRYPLEGAATAHAELEGRRTTGKLLIYPRSPPPG